MGQDHGETVKCPQDQTALEEDHLDHTSGSPLIVMALAPEECAPVGWTQLHHRPAPAELATVWTQRVPSPGVVTDWDQPSNL